MSAEMAHVWHHAVASAKRFGGKPDDYLKIHQFLDETKELVPDFRHRALRHHTLGIFECEERFGVTITNSDGKQVPVRPVAEWHIREDCNGRIPTPQDWLKNLPVEPWMNPHPGYTRVTFPELPGYEKPTED
jgi:hypothetical protein